MSENMRILKMLLLLVFSCNVALATDELNYKWVSIVNLIASPEKYHNEYVGVAGYLSLGPEKSYLCLSDRVPSPKECLWLSGKERSENIDFSNYNNTLALVQGVFNMRELGHLGLNSGTISHITRVSETRWWP